MKFNQSFFNVKIFAFLIFEKISSEFHMISDDR